MVLGKVADNKNKSISITSQAGTQVDSIGLPPKKHCKALKYVKATKIAFDTIPHKMHNSMPYSIKGT